MLLEKSWKVHGPNLFCKQKSLLIISFNRIIKKNTLLSIWKANFWLRSSIQKVLSILKKY
jgi:hypothetical protein